MTLDIHNDIYKKLDFFIVNNKIPNLIFHGSNGSGKRTIVHNFINNIYNNDKELIRNYVLNVNCAHGKGIKFVRDDLKFFAKTNITYDSNNNFKSIILENADSLTSDAQSALRRCIELFSHSTRFFIIVEDKYKLLKPILSRFCEIFIQEPVVNNIRVNLHQYMIEDTFGKTSDDKSTYNWIKKQISNLKNHRYSTLMKLANNMYEKGISGLDLIKYIENDRSLDETEKYKCLVFIHKVKREFRNEKLLIIFILNIILIRSNDSLENMHFI
tara:strand:+ start:676 stop:1488 length:813 start_codon:yes stop_codon:yes gene_type:complete